MGNGKQNFPLHKGGLVDWSVTFSLSTSPFHCLAGSEPEGMSLKASLSLLCTSTFHFQASKVLGTAGYFIFIAMNCRFLGISISHFFFASPATFGILP